MKLKRYLVIASIAIPLILLSACGGGKTSDTIDTSATASDSNVQTDSTKTDNDSTKQAEAPERKFASAQEALIFMQNSGHWNEYQTGIIPRMANEVLEYAGKLLNNKHNYFIVVDKAAMKVILYNKYGNVVKEYGCACARNYGDKRKKGDSRTPEGYFTAEGIYDSTDWLYTNDAGYTSPARGQFGPRFIRLKEAPQIGIHGTAARGSIGRRASHGCIRIQNENILELVKYATPGMPIIVSPGPQDMRVNNSEGHPTRAITTGATKVEPAAEAPKADNKKKPAETTDNKKKVTNKVTPTTPEQPSEEVKASEPAKEEKKPAEKPVEEKKPSTPPVEPVTPPSAF